MASTRLTPAKRRIVERLKLFPASTSGDVADALGVTPSAVRTQLGELESLGLVDSQPTDAAGRGRPSQAWSLTDLAAELFPDRHDELTVGLIEAVRAAVGVDGLEQVLAARNEAQLSELEAKMPANGDIEARAEALAAHRSAQGYMAELTATDDGLVLTEHHCPVCAAATACQGLCRDELTLFRDALGSGAEVEREQHLLSGDARCVYRIRPRP